MQKNSFGVHQEDIVLIDLEDVYVPERTWQKIMRKDRGQIERMLADFESDRIMVRVVLRPRFGGGYNVEDGRHRVIAAKLAEVGTIEAIIIGSAGN
jgi:ParB-like chromosome segregation protein Spo0J